MTTGPGLSEAERTSPTACSSRIANPGLPLQQLPPVSAWFATPRWTSPEGFSGFAGGHNSTPHRGRRGSVGRAPLSPPVAIESTLLPYV